MGIRSSAGIQVFPWEQHRVSHGIRSSMRQHHPGPSWAAALPRASRSSPGNSIVHRTASALLAGTSSANLAGISDNGVELFRHTGTRPDHGWYLRGIYSSIHPCTFHPSLPPIVCAVRSHGLSFHLPPCGGWNTRTKNTSPQATKCDGRNGRLLKDYLLADTKSTNRGCPEIIIRQN